MGQSRYVSSIPPSPPLYINNPIVDTSHCIHTYPPFSSSLLPFLLPPSPTQIEDVEHLHLKLHALVYTNKTLSAQEFLKKVRKNVILDLFKQVNRNFKNLGAWIRGSMFVSGWQAFEEGEEEEEDDEEDEKEDEKDEYCEEDCVHGLKKEGRREERRPVSVGRGLMGLLPSVPIVLSPSLPSSPSSFASSVFPSSSSSRQSSSTAPFSGERKEGRLPQSSNPPLSGSSRSISNIPRPFSPPVDVSVAGSGITDRERPVMLLFGGIEAGNQKEKASGKERGKQSPAVEDRKTLFGDVGREGREGGVKGGGGFLGRFMSGGKP